MYLGEFGSKLRDLAKPNKFMKRVSTSEDTIDHFSCFLIYKLIDKLKIIEIYNLKVFNSERK